MPARSRHCDALDAAGNRATDPRSGRLPAVKTVHIVCETKSGDLPEAYVPAVLRGREHGVSGHRMQLLPTCEEWLDRSFFFGE